MSTCFSVSWPSSAMEHFYLPFSLFEPILQSFLRIWISVVHDKLILCSCPFSFIFILFRYGAGCDGSSAYQKFF